MIREDCQSAALGQKSRVFFRQHLLENCIRRCSKGRLFIASSRL